MQRLLSMRARPCSGIGASIRARLVLDRFDAAGGGLLAAGIAFNALFALIPLAIFASGVIGIFVKDPTSQEAITDFLTGLAPPLAGVLDAIGDLANASTVAVDHRPDRRCVGHDAALRVARARDPGDVHGREGAQPRRDDPPSARVHRWSSPGLVAASIVAATVGSVVLDRADDHRRRWPSSSRCVLFALPYALAVLAILVVYLVVPPVRPPRSALVAAGDRRRRR